MQDWVRERLSIFLGDDVMKKMTKAMLMTALILGSVSMGTAVEANELNTFALDEYVVTATRYEKKDLDVAASVEVFDQERLEATGASNLYEAMQFAAGIEMQQYGTGGASLGNMSSKVSIRGTSNGTLVLLNGIPVNIRGTYDLSDFPIENIERVEIVRGGGSVLYGSEATGGVINIITKKHRDNYIKVASGNFGQREYDASIQAGKLGVNYKYSKWGRVDNVASDKRDWNGPQNDTLNLNYVFNDNLNLSFTHIESKYNYITEGSSAKDTEQTVERNNVQLNYDKDGLKATAYYLDRTREKYERKLSDGKVSTDEENNKNFGLDVQKVWSVAQNDVFLVGSNFKRENYTPSGESLQSRNNFSVYTSYEKSFDDKNSLTLSARESWTTGAPNDYNNTNFSGQAQFVHKVNENTNAYVSVGQSYKMPDLHQIYKTAEGADLKPQTGLHYELGLKKDIDDNRRLRLALFSYDITDNITAKKNDNMPGGFEYTNEDLKNTGIEAEYSMNTDEGFGYNFAVTYGNPKMRETKTGAVSKGWVRDCSRWDLKGALTYKMNKFKAALNGSFVDGRASNGYEIDQSFIVSLNADYQFTKDLSMFIKANNLLDRDDVSFLNSSGTTEYYYTPVNFMVGMKYSF